MTRHDAIAYLLADGNLSVPGGRYGFDTRSCAPIAWTVARIVARESGEPVDRERLEHAMGLVVNGHDDVAYIIRTYNYGHYR